MADMLIGIVVGFTVIKLYDSGRIRQATWLLGLFTLTLVVYLGVNAWRFLQ